MTEERLNELCGGAPGCAPECAVCDKPVGPYYSPAVAREALAEHLRWTHEYPWNHSLTSAAWSTKRAMKRG